MDISNICVIGDDGRMDYAAQAFYDRGYDVYRELSAIDARTVIVLPPPVGEQMTGALLPYLKHGQRIYGGMLSNRLIHECGLLDIGVSDYLKWDQVTEANAVLTARGIIREAGCMQAVMEESNCLVTGYGFCGKALVDALLESKANVDVMVRRKELASVIESRGCGFVDMRNIADSNLEKYSYIYNTVPAMILSASLIKHFSGNVMIFDIASAPGGTDFDYCKQNGIFVMHSLGIPGREFPKEAGEIIARAVIDDISQR